MENISSANLTDEDLGLGTNVQDKTKNSVNKQNTSKTTSKNVKKADDALKNAAAVAALKAAVDANNEISEKAAEKTYIKEKMNFMLNKCKSDKVIKFRGDKIYAEKLGKVYTFLYNGVPVTIKFDGSIQELPEFIYNKVKEKLHEVSEVSEPKVIIEDRTEN